MTDLTEQWKKGELPSRDDDHLWLAYYIKHKDGYIHADSLWRGHWGTADRNSIKEILAPVPSYEEYLSLTYAKEEDKKIIAEYELENAQLKELLRECFDMIYEHGWRFEQDVEKAKDLIVKLNEVLR